MSRYARGFVFRLISAGSPADPLVHSFALGGFRLVPAGWMSPRLRLPVSLLAILSLCGALRVTAFLWGPTQSVDGINVLQLIRQVNRACNFFCIT